MLGVVEVTNELSVLLGIGIFVFFFLVGLDEIDISAFVASIQGRFFVAAIVSLAIALLGALTVTTDFIFDFDLGLSFTAALALSGVLALSSLGLVAKVLSDGGHLRGAGRNSDFYDGYHCGAGCSSGGGVHHWR